MLRHLLTRSGGLALAVAVLALATLTTSCGGGGDGPAPKDMILQEFLFVDRSLNPVAPTGTQNLPRNAQLLFVFSELVDPASVSDQTLQVRFGPNGQSVPPGSFSVNRNTVRFDPTVTAQGQPSPFGFHPVTQYTVDIPSFQEQLDVLRNLDDDPNLRTFFTTFVTSDGFLRELVPPQVVRVYSIPDRFEVNPLTGQWPGNGQMAFEFSEPMDPKTFLLGGAGGPDENTAIDVRYDPSETINQDNGLVTAGVGQAVAGYFTYDAAATTFFFNPTFSFGDKKYVFTAQVFQGLKDLSGNLLINPRSFGPYTCDGSGIETGKSLQEDFLTTANLDFVNSDADWGFTDEGVLQGQAITTREQRIYSYTFEGPGPNDIGQYAAIVSPFAGAALNQYQANVTPPTSEGRRVMWAFSDTEMGEAGSITGASWGPDSNATFAALYPNVILRCGYQKNASMTLSPSYSGNYDGSPTVVYTGPYQVPQQANVGNTTNPTPGVNTPLFTYTGFEPWPDFSTFFEWDPGDTVLAGDSVLLFDASVQEGDTWQQLRGWFAVTSPGSGILISGFPARRMYSTYEADSPNPQSNFALGILNPEPSVTDTAFSITKRVSIAQTLFYTDGAQPGTPSVPTTYGTGSDYRPMQLTPSVQTNGATVRVEYQAANAVEADRRTINQGAPFLADWTENVNDCDGYANIRWRIYLVSNLISGTVAKVTNVIVPVINQN